MNRPTLVLRSLRFYWRTHLGVLLGCALSAAVLVGALGVGDSVRRSLERIARARLGRVEAALDTGSRYFRDDLAARLRTRLGAEVAGGLRVRGMAIRDGGAQVNRVDVLGVEGAFFRLAESPPTVTLGPGDLAANEKLASALGVRVGDEVSLRIFKPGLLSRDAPLASRRDRETRRRRFTLRAVLSEAELGRFNLKSDQAGPHNAFVDLRALQAAIEMEGRANLLLVGGASADAAAAALREVWEIDDAGLVIRPVERLLQLQSPRIYLDPAASSTALRPDSVGMLGYLVNSISAEGGKSTPYSFVTALTPTADRGLGLVPAGMKDDEILVNRWLADQLSLRPGDRVKVGYSELTPGDKFVERERWFAVREVLGMDAFRVEKDLVPEFPGLTDVESCKDWDVGLPMDEKKVKDPANEAYWKAHRQTPKAFVTLAAGREMWANRFGDLMAVRYPASTSAGELRASLRSRIDPAETGLVFQPVRERAARAVSESMDLGQLFLGMSVFLIAAALTLTVMLFVFTVERRAPETGTLLAVGYTRGGAGLLLLGEGAVLAALGSLGGIPLGWGFAKFLLWGLGGAWAGAVANVPIAFHAGAASALAGAGAAAALSLLAMGVALRVQSGKTVRGLVSPDVSAGGRPLPGKILFGAGLGGAAAVAAGTLLSGAERPAPAFFAAGALMLIGGLSLIRMALSRLSEGSGLSVSKLGVRNAARRPGRGVAAAGMLACGCFIVCSVGAMKQDLSLDAGERRSGTGGFELYGESSIAVHDDLNEPKGRAALRLTDPEVMRGVSFVPLKVREGDDASCLNLNQSLAPPLLGVDAGRMAALGAFSPEVWELLDRADPDGAVPAVVGDSATAVWKLKKRMGELLDYTDERGRRFTVRLVAALPFRLSVLQGRLLISNAHFTRLFPSEAGARAFLVDVPPENAGRVIGYFAEKLEGVGLDLGPSVDRLKEFYVVESTYLMMFLVLGGLGLLLGSAGMGVLVFRTVMERRSELALLRAVGYSRGEACGLVMAEHRFLVAAGLLAGTAAAALAVAPAAAQPGVQVPFGWILLFLAGTAGLCLAWIWVAARLALRAPLIPALRNE